MNIQIGDTVQITNSRFAVPRSDYATLYQRLWAKYGKRIGVVESFTNECPHLPGDKDADAAVIRFEDGDSVAWETHLITRVY